MSMSLLCELRFDLLLVQALVRAEPVILSQILRNIGAIVRTY